MADDTAKTQQNDAPIPDWLKNAQNLAQHEEAAGVAAKPAETTVQGGNSSAGTTTAGAPPGEVADAPLPAWLTKAAEKASQPASAPAPTPEPAPVPVTTVAPTPVVEASPVAATTPAPLAAPASVVAPIIVSPVSGEPVPVSGEPPKSSDKPDNALPGWLQNIQREQKVLKGEPAATPSTDVSQIAPGQIASGQGQSPAADAVVLPVEQRVAETGQGVPAGMLETRVVTAEKPVAVADLNAGKPAAEEPKPKVDEAAKAAANQKTDMFKSAESAFLSFLGKSSSAIQKGQTAGAQKAAVAESVNATEPEMQAVTAVPVAGKAPENAVPAAGKIPEKAPTKAPTGKAAEDKATAEERRQLVEAEKIYQQGLTTIRDLIAPSSMDISYD